MKHLELIPFILFVAFSSYGQSDSGLVAHWRFSGNLRDATGKGHDGVGVSSGSGSLNPYNVLYTTSMNGTANAAARLNDSTGTGSGCIRTIYKSDVNLSQYTICAIVKPTQYSYYTYPFSPACNIRTIISQRLQQTTLGGTYGLALADVAYDSTCTLPDTAYTFYPRGIFNNHYKDWQYTPTVTSNQWYKVVLTFDSVNFRLYTNDTLTLSVPAQSYAFGHPGTALTIGGEYSYSPMLDVYNVYNLFKGLIDDIKLYNRVLDSSEIVTYGGSLNDTLVFISQPYYDTLLCTGTTYNVPFETQNNFNTGNVFTVQLSDSNGNFANAVSIGTLAGTSSGNINVTIPANTPVAKGYRIRIVSSSPIRYSYDNGIELSIGNIKPTKPIASSNSPVCMGQQLIVTAGSGPGNVSYQWLRQSNPGSYWVISNNQSYTDNYAGWSDSGKYIVRTILNGCASDTTILNVSINPLPSLNFDPNTNIACLYDTLFFPPPINQYPTTYYWTTSIGFSDTSTNIYIPITPNTTYPAYVNITAINSLGCNATWNNLPYQFYPTYYLPSLSISGNSVINPGDTATLNVSNIFGGNTAQFQWQKNGVDITGATSQTLKAWGVLSGDVFRLRMVTSDSCVYPDTIFSNNITIQINTTGLNNVSTVNQNIRLYPNPNSGSFTIEGSYKANTELSIEIINSLGQIVHSESLKLQTGVLQKTIQPHAVLPAGVYTLKTDNGNATILQRFIIVK